MNDKNRARGRLIAYYRRLAHMTQKELAEKLGLSSKAISAWETGRNEPNMGQAYDLAGIFHIDVVDLMIGPTIEESQKEEIMELINTYKQADDLTKKQKTESHRRDTLNGVSRQFYSPVGEFYCFAVIFGLRRVVFASRVLGLIEYH